MTSKGTNYLASTSGSRLLKMASTSTVLSLQHNTPTGTDDPSIRNVIENSICLFCWSQQQADLRPNRTTIPEKTAGAKYLLTQLETPIEGIEYAAKVAKESGTQVILNPAPARPLSDSLLSLCWCDASNETGAEVLTGITVTDSVHPLSGSLSLHAKGIETVMITLGAKGVWVSKTTRWASLLQGSALKQQTQPLRVIPSTAHW